MFAAKQQNRSKSSNETVVGRAPSKSEQAKNDSNLIWHQLATQVQPKIAVTHPSDPYEQEADRVAGRVMRMPETVVQRKCASCEGSDSPCPKCASDEDRTIQRNAEPGSGFLGAWSPASHVYPGNGQPLDSATRAFFEPRLGGDLGDIRVHTDARATQSARTLNALAYTAGRDIVFGTGQYAPETTTGRSLLAHELTHVHQQASGRAPASIQRFHLPHGADPKHQGDETPYIAPTFNDLLATLKAIMNACTVPSALGDTVNMDLFVQKAGGRPATADIDKKLGTKSTPSVPSMLNYRYLFTCRCGFIDMRHFLQLMYVSNFIGASFVGVDANKAATKKGREHELRSESESRFGSEDTPSNALGAFVGSGLAATPMPDDLLGQIETVLRRCDPIDFATLSPASQDTIKHYYGDLGPDPAPRNPGDLIPAHQNETARPAVLGVLECGGKERSFPFELDASDPDKKTISETAFDTGASDLTSDSDIRDFVSTQRPEIIKALATAEKVRLVKRLFTGWVSDGDIDVMEAIYKNSTDPEKVQIRKSIDIDDLTSVGQRTRLKVIFS